MAGKNITRRTTRSTQIVIKNLDQFKFICDLITGNGGIDRNTAGFKRTAEILDPKSRLGQLWRWLYKHNGEICTHGEKKLLDTQARNWKTYVKENWSKNDGGYTWFQANRRAIFGSNSNIAFYSRSGYDFYNFDDFLEHNQRFIKWGNWPFARKARAVKKTRKSR